MEQWQPLITTFSSDLILQGRKKETVRAYRNHLFRFLDNLKAIHPEQCTTVYIQHACRQVLTTHHSSYQGYGSRKLFKAAVQSFLRWCMQNGHMPTSSLSLPLFSNNRCTARRTAPILKEEITLLLQTIRNHSSCNRQRDEALFATYAFTGVRRSEPLSMRFLDYDQNGKELYLQNKGGNRKRKPVIHELAVILRSYLEILAQRSPQILHNNLFLFPGRDGNQHMSPRQVNNLFNKWKKRAEIRDELTIHSFRAGFATSLYQECRDPVLVSNALDHRDLRTIATYVDMTSDLSDVMGRALIPG